MDDKKEKPKTLEFFCKDNKASVIKCAWIDTPYCLKSCNYYKEAYKKNEAG